MFAIIVVKFSPRNFKSPIFGSFEINRFIFNGPRMSTSIIRDESKIILLIILPPKWLG